jgi:hypothetical protein
MAKSGKKTRLTEAEQKELGQKAALGMSSRRLAAYFEIDRKTMTDHYGDIIEKQRAIAEAELLKAQWKSALKGNPTLLVWLGKQLLGQADKPENKDAEKMVAARHELELKDIRKYLEARKRAGAEPLLVEVQQNAVLADNGAHKEIEAEILPRDDA